MKIGIIGAENSHTARIAEIFNIEKKIKGATVQYVWGETAEFARAAAQAGAIPHIVKKSTDMLGKIDAIIVDHCHPKYHLKAALPFIKKGIPTFIDKPFCFRSQKGKDFLKTAKKYKTPVTSFSILPLQKSFSSFVRKISALGPISSASTWGPSDLKSKYGGLFYYGIHQVDLALIAFGYNVKKVLVTKNGTNAAAQLLYPDNLIITINLLTTAPYGFQASALGKNGSHYQNISMDKSPYLKGAKTFSKMFKTGVEPIPYENMLKPVQVMEALERSIKSGKLEKVS